MATVKTPLGSVAPGDDNLLPTSRSLSGSVAHADGNTLVWEFSPLGATGIKVIIDCTVRTGTSSMTPKIEGITFPDGPTGAAVVSPLLTGAAIAATGQVTLTVHPAVPAVANVTAQTTPPDLVRVTFTPADAQSMTYSASIILTH